MAKKISAMARVYYNAIFLDGTRKIEEVPDKNNMKSQVYVLMIKNGKITMNMIPSEYQNTVKEYI